MSISAKTRKGIYERDGFRCAADGPGCTRFTTLTIHHRINRGMGGSRLLDGRANLLTLCATCNGLLESDAAFADLGRERGWKLFSWENPVETAVWFSWAAEWRRLDAEGDARSTTRFPGVEWAVSAR